jgi:hypothetical protein
LKIADTAMAISEKEHIDALRAADLRRLDALRAADQRAVELLAEMNAIRIRNNFILISILVSVGSMLVAIFAALGKH